MPRPVAPWMVALVALGVSSGGARATTLIRLAPDAEVHSVGFRFEGPHVLHPPDLEPYIATTAPGLGDKLSAVFAWVPFVPDPKRHPVHPPTLQADAERLRRRLRREGFPSARVEYEVETRKGGRQADVTFRIEEGTPLVLREVRLGRAVAGDSLPPLSDSLFHAFEPKWNKTVAAYSGKRYREDDVAALGRSLTEPLADAGFPFALAQTTAAIDSSHDAVDLTCAVRGGPRLRVSGFEVDGVRSVPARLATRQLGIDAGDWVSRRRLADGRTNVQTVALFRRADVDLGTVADGPSGPEAPIKLHVEESTARFTNLEIGYVTDGAGVTSQARWTHPNFTGGARSLDAVALVQTGWGVPVASQDRLVRASLTLTQYYVGMPPLSLSAGPVFEKRDDRIDNSTAVSGLATLVYRLNSLQSIALRYDYTYRRLDALPLETVEASGFVTRSLLDTLKVPTRTSKLVFFGSLGKVDDLGRPRHGLVVKPKLSMTFPPAAGNVEFGGADGQISLFLPAPGRDNSLMLRSSSGGLWPFGQSRPAPGESPAVDLLRMRDELLTAGGPSDVRAWATRNLGPKIPNVVAEVDNGDTVFTAHDYYAPGGLARISATAELRIGLPFFSRDIFSHWFIDAGRVWIEDPRFQPRRLSDDDERMFYGTGAGLAYYTRVGAIRVDAGYKLNPSMLDLRHAEDVVAAELAGRNAETAPVDSRRRWAYHLSLGVVF